MPPAVSKTAHVSTWPPGMRHASSSLRWKTEHSQHRQDHQLIRSGYAVVLCTLQLQPHRGGGKAARRQQGDGGDDGDTGLQYSRHISIKTRRLGSYNGWLQWSKLTPVSGRSLPFQTVFVEPC